jgi:hypothetical protein
VRRIYQNNQLFFAPTFIAILSLATILYAINVHPISVKPYAVYRLYLPAINNNSAYSEDWVLKEIKNKSVKTYTLTGDAEDQRKIDMVGYEALKIKYTTDSNAVIKIHFEEQTTYGEFAQLVDIMNRDKHQRYVFFNDNFYIFGGMPEKPKKENIIQPPLLDL